VSTYSCAVIIPHALFFLPDEVLDALRRGRLRAQLKQRTLRKSLHAEGDLREI
jgi:hypothetical protein